MEEKQKLLIMKILVILGVIICLFNIIMAFIGDISVSEAISAFAFIAIAIILIIMLIKPDGPIPFKGLIILILGIVMLVLGFVLSMGMGLVGVVIGGISLVIAGILDLVIK